MVEERPTRRVSKGKCSFCGGTFAKNVTTNHLKSCKARTEAHQLPSSARRPQKTRLFHLVAEGRDAPDYWLHLEMPASATLRDLDRFLRDVWLECCGHLSAFTIGRQSYASTPDGNLGDMSMSVPLHRVVGPGMRFSHEYDFGTTTELTLRVVSEREGATPGRPIGVLAANDPPDIRCDSCGKAATQVCRQCVYESTGWLCDECAAEHACGDEMALSVVNSPRVGMCGYDGPGWTGSTFLGRGR